MFTCLFLFFLGGGRYGRVFYEDGPKRRVDLVLPMPMMSTDAPSKRAPLEAAPSAAAASQPLAGESPPGQVPRPTKAM